MKNKRTKSPNRTRKNCSGISIDKEDCNLNLCPIDCKWGSFGNWSECTKTCGGGERIRARTKIINTRYGGLPCNGTANQTITCNTQSCRKKF